MEVARTAVMMVFGIVLPLLLQWWDKRHLSDAQRARSWNFASWGSALYAFGPASMLGWCWVTRPRWHRCYAGPVAMALLMVVMALTDSLLLLSVGREAEFEAFETVRDSALAALVATLLLGVAEGAGALVRALRS